MLENLYKTPSIFLISVLFFIMSNIPAFSQEASGLSLGKPLETIREPGEIYLAGSKGDWNVRCITGNPGETDRCEIQQLLFLNENTPVADISIFKLPEGEVAVAAANIMVPLETLLTKKFQFAFFSTLSSDVDHQSKLMNLNLPLKIDFFAPLLPSSTFCLASYFL